MLVYAWNNCLHLGNAGWMMGFVHPGIIILTLIPVSTFIFLKSRWGKTLEQRVAGMAALLITSCFVLWGYGRLQEPITLKHDKFTVSTDTHHHLTFIDNGYFNKKATPDKGVEFDLKPYLTKKFGTPIINHLILNKPSQRSFLGALALCENYMIQKITVPFWKQKDNNQKICWAYGKLKRKTQELKITLNRSGTGVSDEKNITSTSPSRRNNRSSKQYNDTKEINSKNTHNNIQPKKNFNPS